ncbi:MAG: FHA domain-containing protein [Gemmatimonadales bacterium]|nr:FHA domain-containing protein [Gemmatimonadales bacterium]
MRARFEFLSGAREGESEVLDGNYLQLGRHSSSSLRFDAERDLQVSGHHATIFLRGGYYVLRDAGSTNGTFINAVRLTADHILADEDEIQFGPQGPTVRFRIIRESADHHPGGFRPAPIPRAPQPAEPVFPAAAEGSSESARRAGPGPGTRTRIRAEVARQTATVRRRLYAVAAVATIAVSAVVWQRLTQNASVEKERQAMLDQVDSLMRELGSLTINVQTLRERFDSAQRETARLRDLVSRPDQGVDEMRVLRRQLEDALAHQRHIALAASLDVEAIARANQDAVGIVLAEFADGTRTTGTAFGIRSDPGAGLILTNKHVILGDREDQPIHLGIVFEGSSQNFRADVVSTHPDVDMALLRVRVRGGIPQVASLRWREPPVAVGDAVAILGYPLGLDLPMGGDWQEVGITATIMTGSVTRVLPDLIQFDSFGVEGSSGSPVFDRQGNVVGIVFGGETGRGGRIVYAVPIVYALELLDGLR